VLPLDVSFFSSIQTVVLDPLNSKGWSLLKWAEDSFLPHFHMKYGVYKRDKINNLAISIGKKS